MASTTTPEPPRQTFRAGVRLDERSTYHSPVFSSRVTVDGVPESFSAASNLPSLPLQSTAHAPYKNSHVGQSAEHDAQALKFLTCERGITERRSQ